MGRQVELAFLHPLWLTAAWIVSAVALLCSVEAGGAFDTAGSIFPAPWPIAFAVALSFASAFLLPLAWVHGVFRAAHLAMREEGTSRLSDWTFWLAGAGCALAVLASPAIMMSDEATLEAIGYWPNLVGMGVAAAYVASFWTAATTLVRFEGRTGQSDGKVAGTFVLLLYWIIGAWLLRPRLMKLKAALTAAPGTSAA
ncbi:hypothetical protein [Brevundimonas lenta]|uniref:Putative lysophospholipase L1 biosynthesis ABC-type transport system permease subunit n=1 Tax=Brevundimonas lenta TaxID=424796 RepID=A0A7W6JB15_9CAUL|nr:hypothetical protein [Brevundimonas lenta]MBB4081794.1 putative lysophospholipase L1 biosynthesis ABC-type transport system permease subunit [Brevundimonas lenta]